MAKQPTSNTPADLPVTIHGPFQPVTGQFSRDKGDLVDVPFPKGEQISPFKIRSK